MDFGKRKLKKSVSLQSCFPSDEETPPESESKSKSESESESESGSPDVPANSHGNDNGQHVVAESGSPDVLANSHGNDNGQHVADTGTILVTVDYNDVRNGAEQRSLEAEVLPAAPLGEACIPSAENLTVYVPLYQAALKGDWKTAKAFFDQHPEAVTATITKRLENALHIAAGAKQVKFVEELAKLMDPRDLSAQNKVGNTALCFAAASGIIRIAEVMVEKNDNLPMIRGCQEVTPLYMAALLGYKDMVWYLLKVTDPQHLTEKDYVDLIIATISTDLYDVALRIIRQTPGLAIERDPSGETALHVLARKPSAFSCKEGLSFWQKWIFPWVRVHFCNKSSCKSCVALHQNKKGTTGLLLMDWLLGKIGIKEVQEKKMARLQALELLDCIWIQIMQLDDPHIRKLLRNPSRPLFVAAESGNFEYIVELLRSYPDLMWRVDEKSQTFFHIAVRHRQERIFKLIYQIGALKDLITSYKSTSNKNMLHLAAKLAPANRLKIVSGAALQMQRELLWFKEVEKNVQPLYKEMRDSMERTPRMLFTEEHEELLKQGEEWMKSTASSSMLVATLIATVMFAAIFTVPGGYTNDSGTPIFLKDKAFLIFSIADALALFSSVTSILMFLSILTSRYAEEDFVETLPKRLIIGLATLFFSMATMLIAFSASFSLIHGHQLAWIVIPVALGGCIPVTLFAFSQFPLMADLIYSTYGSGIFAENTKDILF